MASSHAYELLPHTSVPAEAVDTAEHGQIVYLTRNGEPIAGIVPANMGAQIEAAENTEDLDAALAAREEPGNPVPAARLWAELGLRAGTR